MSLTLFSRNARVAPAVPVTRIELEVVLADPDAVREFFAVESMIDGTTRKFLDAYGHAYASAGRRTARRGVPPGRPGRPCSACSQAARRCFPHWQPGGHLRALEGLN